jgi:hypothetical protein
MRAFAQAALDLSAKILVQDSSAIPNVWLTEAEHAQELAAISGLDDPIRNLVYSPWTLNCCSGSGRPARICERCLRLYAEN